MKDFDRRIRKAEGQSQASDNEEGMVEMLLTESLECIGYRYAGRQYDREEDIPIRNWEGIIFYPISVADACPGAPAQ